MKELEKSKWAREAKVFYDEITSSSEFIAFGKALKDWEGWFSYSDNYAKQQETLAKLKEELREQVKVSDIPTSPQGKKAFDAVS